MTAMNEFFEALGSFFRDMLLYSLIAIFMENTVFSRGLGTSTALFATRKKHDVLLIGGIMTAIVTAAALILYFIFPYLRSLSYSYYIIPPVYVLVVGVVYAAALLITYRFASEKNRLKILKVIHVCAFNCATLGALMLATNNANGSFGAFMGFAIGSAIGFTMATYFIGIAYERLSSEQVPAAFRGFPITLIYIGLVSLAIYGLIGHELPM